MITILIILLLAATLIVWVMRRSQLGSLLEVISYSANDDVRQRGISVLVSGRRDLTQIEALLMSDYAHYEVIIVGDWLADEVLFKRIQSAFSLLEVNYSPLGELPEHPIRGLYRSRKRLFRRLVVVDRAKTSIDDDLDVGASVAIYENLLAIRGGATLREDALSRLLLLLATHDEGSIDSIQSSKGEPWEFTRRELVVSQGGYSPKRKSGDRSRMVFIWQPLLNKN